MQDNKKIKSIDNFPIGKYSLSQEEFLQLMRSFPFLDTISNDTKLKGPFDGKINSMYLFKNLQIEDNINNPNVSGDQDILFRCRVSQAFRYEDCVKEKILYPFLDGTLSIETPKLGEKIKSIVENREGKYIFSTERDKQPIVPVQNLLYYYEPDASAKSNHNKSGNFSPSDILAGTDSPTRKFPYNVSIKDYISGRSMYDVLETLSNDEKESPAILELYRNSGENLAKLHNAIQFDSFYTKITDIGNQKKKNSWITLFKEQWGSNIKDASQHKAFQPLIDDLNKYYKENISLIEDENIPVFFHNDYQIQNIIIEENMGIDTDFTNKNKYKIIGLIDFDNWRIGPRAQDFIKMEYWSIKDNLKQKNAFYEGYSKYYPIKSDMKSQIKIYKILWFILVYAFEMDKSMKNETDSIVDSRFPSAQKYVEEIKNILHNSE